MSNFSHFKLSKSVLFSISKMGYESPTKVQEKAIPIILEGKDLVAQAQTGTGKTAAFGIPLIERINPKEKIIQALVLVPTRELAIQVANELRNIGRRKKIFVLPVYGGKSIQNQIRFLRKGNDTVVVGTPGRVKDLIERGYLKLDNIKMFILDEADRMLDMGFIEDIEFIISQLPKDRQNLLFSATMPKAILNLAEKFLNENYEILKLSPEKITVEKIKQKAYRVDDVYKLDNFVSILKETLDGKAIVFTKTKKTADNLAKKLASKGFNSGAIHGDFSQKKREKVLKDFKEGKINVLVATDIAARGLDIKGVNVVYNFDLPTDVESYVHRIGRTGRAGNKGFAVSFFTPKEDLIFFKIMKTTKADIDLLNNSKVPLKKNRFNKKRKFLKA